MQKKKMSGRAPRSLGSDRHRTDGGAGDDVDVECEVAQPARTNGSTRRRRARRFMAIF
jgi:hypothetical protein